MNGFAWQLFSCYEDVTGYYECYHSNPLPSPASASSLQSNSEKIEILRMKKLAFFSSPSPRLKGRAMSLDDPLIL